MNVNDRGSARLSYQPATCVEDISESSYVIHVFSDIRCIHSIVTKIPMYLPINRGTQNVQRVEKKLLKK